MSLIPSGTGHAIFHFAASLACCWFLAAGAAGQSPAAERTFHATKAEVQKALHEIQSYPGGKLPTLEGFAEPGDRSLDKYQRGYYEYALHIRNTSATETTVQVDVKITAWYAGASPANSSYKVLRSSGRLESDLLDALDDKLNPAAARKHSTVAAGSGPAAAALPDSPSTSGAGTAFHPPRWTTAPSVAPKPAATAVSDPVTSKRVSELSQQAASLEEILHNQARPTNLAVVKSVNTPVVAQPTEGAQVLFHATAEDEFEVLDETEGWVHIKISSISRGWLRRDYVDLPGAATVSLSVQHSEGDKEPVRQTKEEIGLFPGKWEPLDGRKVKIIWVQPTKEDQFGSESKWVVAKSVFRKADTGAPGDNAELAGVVVIFDSQDGGMAATSMANLQQWRAGHLSDDAFWKRCWRDPEESFKTHN